MAAGAHLAVGDGESIGAFMALALLATSYFTDKIQSYGIILLLTIVFTIWFSQNSFSELVTFADVGGLNSFETLPMLPHS